MFWVKDDLNFYQAVITESGHFTVARVVDGKLHKRRVLDRSRHQAAKSKKSYTGSRKGDRLVVYVNGEGRASCPSATGRRTEARRCASRPHRPARPATPGRSPVSRWWSRRHQAKQQAMTATALRRRRDLVANDRLVDLGDLGDALLCTFSNARTSIWRMRSRDTPNSLDRSSSVAGLSVSLRASKMRRSRSFSEERALER